MTRLENQISETVRVPSNSRNSRPHSKRLLSSPPSKRENLKDDGRTTLSLLP
jgi:hypothetical protein